MEVRFLKETPYTKRPGSTKKFLRGQVVVVDIEYGAELIRDKLAVEVKPATLSDFKKKKT